MAKRAMQDTPATREQRKFLELFRLGGALGTSGRGCGAVGAAARAMAS